MYDTSLKAFGVISQLHFIIVNMWQDRIRLCDLDQFGDEIDIYIYIYIYPLAIIYYFNLLVIY